MQTARASAPILLTAAALCSFLAPTAAGAQDAAATAEANAAPADDRWTPALSMRFHQVGSLAISNDGGKVAYTVREPLMEGEKSEYLSHIWVADADGSRNVQFTRGEHSAGSPAFSPDGAWLAFATGRSGSSQIWVIAMAGGEARQVTDAKPGVGQFRWSPAGDAFAFVMRDPQTEEEEKAAKEKRDVEMVDQNFKYGHLYTVPFDPVATETAEATRVTEGDFHVTGFDWSPDGSQLVFAHQADPRINTGRLSGDIALVSANGGDVSQLVTGPGVESSPRWSPDGSLIAYGSTGDQPEPVGLSDLYVVDPESGDVRMLPETPNRSVFILGWSADSDDIFLNESLGTTRHVIAVPVDGGEIRQVTEGAGVVGATALAAGAERLAVTWETNDEPREVHVTGLDAFRPVQLSSVTADVPLPPMGRTELLAWEAPDGTPVEGLLTYPVGYEEGSQVPLILNVHGGPAGVFAQSFTGNPSIYMIQYFAQEGMAVLRPNPRGSTGYGKEFRYANFMDWGYGDLSDLLAGVDEVIEMGVAHPDSLLLMGWSYGGYMTSFAVTQTDRFRAASMGAGLPNLVSMVTTTDIGDYLVGHMGDEYFNDYETYERHSAVYHIKNVTTPTQVIHGALDLRVPFTQGQEFYTSLLRLGVDTEFVVYPRTPHGPTEPKFLMDVSERILVWFNKYLREPRPTAEEG
ncbi:MAG: S9 family peptidase [Gemmatimonadetes bacterium]|nr:S9 family peptidase [Gemmatimonadota bacterium]